LAPPFKRLLFVDDEPAIRVTLSAILRRYGFFVTVAATVAEALEQIRTSEFDLLLCDLNIEREGDGYEVIRAIREVNPRCVTIVLTGHPALESAVEGIHLGIDDYILKPAQADALVALLAEKLAARQPKRRVLAVSYDEQVLRSWATLLEGRGYVVNSVKDDAGIRQCKPGEFDALVLGSSVPNEKKKILIEEFRRRCQVPIISLQKGNGEHATDAADYQCDGDPELLLKLIDNVTSRNAALQKSEAQSAASGSGGNGVPVRQN